VGDGVEYGDGKIQTGRCEGTLIPYYSVFTNWKYSIGIQHIIYKEDGLKTR